MILFFNIPVANGEAIGKCNMLQWQLIGTKVRSKLQHYNNPSERNNPCRNCGIKMVYRVTYGSIYFLNV